MAAATLCADRRSAQSGRPTLVFVCDEQSEACKTWRSQWEPLFAASPAYKKIDAA